MEKIYRAIIWRAIIVAAAIGLSSCTTKASKTTGKPKPADSLKVDTTSALKDSVARKIESYFQVSNKLVQQCDSIKKGKKREMHLLAPFYADTVQQFYAMKRIPNAKVMEVSDVAYWDIYHKRYGGLFPAKYQTTIELLPKGYVTTCTWDSLGVKIKMNSAMEITEITEIDGYKPGK